MMRHEMRGVHSLRLGTDPEVFLSKETGRIRKRIAIIGSEMVVPTEGMNCISSGSTCGKVVRDGVQVELHPTATTCRQSMGYYIKNCLAHLNAEVAKHKGLKIDFRQVVTLSRGDLMKLQPDSRELGCMPSLNIYGKEHIILDGEKYLTRSAAGHIHMGSQAFNGPAQFGDRLDPVRAVRIMDVLVGNQSVLMDRDPLAAERRKAYGRAGEYRLPPHGLEYRTLSNFWLRDYKLMSFVMGMTKMAHLVMQSSIIDSYYAKNPQCRPSFFKGAWPAEAELMSRVDLRLIEQAINTNDFDLAWSNWETMVRPFIQDLNCSYGLTADSIPNFEHFIRRIRDEEEAGRDPLGYWFKDDTLMHWLNISGWSGWENYLATTVSKDGATLVRSKIVLPDVAGVVITPSVPDTVAAAVAAVIQGPSDTGYAAQRPGRSVRND